jgi:sodium-dependent phosphate cotransporter
MVLSKVEVFFDKYIFKTAIRALLFGMLLTFMVQSSSITTSLIVPLAGAGVLSLRQIFPYTLGANIGTTATALLAALSLNVTALVTAFAHLIFNIFGILIIYPIPFIRNIPIKLAETLAEYSIKNRLIPFAYLLIVFIVIPFTIIYFGGK